MHALRFYAKNKKPQSPFSQAVLRTLTKTCINFHHDKQKYKYSKNAVPCTALLHKVTQNPCILPHLVSVTMSTTSDDSAEE